MDGRLRLREKDVYRWIQAGILLCIFLFGAENYLNIDNLRAIHFLAAFGMIALIAGMQLVTGRERLLCLLFAVVFIFITGMIVGVENIFAFFTDYFNWLADGGVRRTEWLFGYELMQAVIVAVFCYFLAVLLERYAFLKFVISCLFICILLFCLLTGEPFHHAGIAFMFCYMAAAYAEWVQFNWKKVRNKERKARLLWLMPFLALYLLLMLWTPAPEEPYGWQFVKEMCSQIKESFLSLSQNLLRNGEEDFDTALSGFTEDGELHGGIEEDAREIMIVQGMDSLVTNVYLTGRIYDTFNGRQWQQKNHDREPERFSDTVETLYAVEKFGKMSSWNYLSRTKLKIKYQYFNTSYLFVPLKAERLEESGGTLSYFWDGGSLLFQGKEKGIGREEKRGYGTEYDVTYLQMNVGATDFLYFLAAGQNASDRTVSEGASAAGDASDGTASEGASAVRTAGNEADTEKILTNLLKDCEKNTGLSITAEDLENHRRKIHEIYTEEIILSKEVQNYLDKITRYAPNDVEKLRLIESELLSYTYTKNPDKLPGTITDAGEFLDYFLLESREGYCTYFATAFTLLARAEGFPARYVQGFCVPMESGGETTVFSDMAHSWPEVYIDGIGWIPFEPTPGYARLRYTPWQTESGNSNHSESAAIVSHHDIDTIEETELFGENLSQTDWESMGSMRSRINLRNVFRIVMYTIPAALFLFAVLLALERWIRKRRYQRMAFSRKFQAEVTENLRILAWLGLRRKRSETFQEFKERAGETLREFKECSGEIPAQGTEMPPPLKFIESYEAVLYGGKEVKQEMITAAEKERELLLAELKRRKKRLYFYYKIRYA